MLSFFGTSSLEQQLFYNYPHMSIANNFHTHPGLVKLASSVVLVYLSVFQCVVGTATVVFLNHWQCF